jgi:hypothetical protein
VLILASVLCATLFSCDKKTENIGKVTAVACQDVKDMLESHTPLVAKLILNAVVKDEVKNGAVCDCILPAVKKHLNEYTAEQVEAMLVEKQARTKAIKKALSQNSAEVFDCYKSKGLKGAKLIEDFVKKIVN